MLIAFRSIAGSKLTNRDEAVGTISDLFVDAKEWIVRYLVVDTGTWLPGKKVLLPPIVMGECDWEQSLSEVALTRQQVKDSPDIDTQKPVSREMELELMTHYNIPFYWGPAGTALVGSSPIGLPRSVQVAVKDLRIVESRLPNLRSASEVKGYYVKAIDGEMGHIDDFVIDDQAWVIRYMVIDTKNWLPARKVLVSPEWVETISWSAATVEVNMTRDEIKGSPVFDPSQPVNRGYEEHMYDYYGRECYWLP